MLKTDYRVAAYYDQEIASLAMASGAGLIWFMGRDHLSPALSDSDKYALNSNNWRQATSNRVVELAKCMDMSAGKIALDLRAIALTTPVN